MIDCPKQPCIAVLTDSGCDIPWDIAQKAGLNILPFPITVDGKDTMQGTDFFTPQEFYSIMQSAHDFPKHAQITPMRYYEAYDHFFKKGYQELIVITITSVASSTYENALTAREMYYQANPSVKDLFKIHVVNSRCYSIPYGYPALESCRMARQGESSDTILAYLEDWFSRVEIYVAAYSLEYAKRSGRIGSVSAVLGEALGIRPIIRIVDGVASVYQKVRGASAIETALFEIMRTRYPAGSPYGILSGTFPQVGASLENALVSFTGRKPFGHFLVGPAIALNIGPQMLGIAFLAEKPRHYVK